MVILLFYKKGQNLTLPPQQKQNSSTKNKNLSQLIMCVRRDLVKILSRETSGRKHEYNTSWLLIYV